MSKDLKELKEGAKLVAAETIPGKSPEEGMPVFKGLQKGMWLVLR